MYCHKCGGAIAAATKQCPACGVTIDHGTNQEAFLNREFSSMHIHVHHQADTARSPRWLLLSNFAVPMILLVYVIKVSFEKLSLVNSLALDLPLLGIVFGVAAVVFIGLKIKKRNWTS